jgi:hypothetical protein
MTLRVSLLAALVLLGPAATAQAMSGGTCSASIASFKRAVEGDAKTGNMHQSVYRRVKPEIDRAEAACAAGRDAEAVRMINATKGRYGYN